MSALRFGRFMLPRCNISYWPVIACDQYTSRPEYWMNEDKRVGDMPSSLRLICPEAFLTEADKRMADINACSRDYAEKVLKEYNGGVLVTRTGKRGRRCGLVCLADMECYDYTTGGSLIRATEGTVAERIPPRLAVRESSVLDVSHVICLIDDPGKTVIEPLEGKGELLYDIQLSGGDRLEGRLISDKESVSDALDRLQEQASEEHRPFVLVGDGNHSLAAAKALYESYKRSGDERAASARYALVEVENVRSDGVVFLPIHRIIYGMPGLACRLESLGGDGHITLVRGDECIEVRAPSEPAEAYASVQSIIDESGAEVDYIHGDDEIRRICGERTDALGILMPPLDKSGLFDYIALHGVLPRKSFSMGEAEDKRYYMECRLIDGRSE